MTVNLGLERGEDEPTTHLSPDLSRVASGALLNATCSALGSLGTFALVVIVARALGPVGAGHYFQAIALVTIVVAAATCGAEPGVIRQISAALARQEPGVVRPTLVIALGPAIIVGMAATAVLELFAPEVSRSLATGATAEAVLTHSLRLLAPIVPVMAIERVLTATTRGLNSVVATATIDGAGQPVGRLLLAIAVAGVGPSLFGFSLAWSIPGAFALLVAAVWVARLVRKRCLPHGAWWVGVAHKRRLAREFWSFTSARGLALIFQVSTVWLGVLLVGWWSSSRNAGIYAATNRAAVVGLLVLQSINLVLAPHIASSIAASHRRSAERLYQIATGWAVTVGFPLYILLGIFPRIFLFAFGPRYQSGSVALGVICGAMLWNILTGPVTVVLLMGGRSTWNLWNAAATLATNVGVGALLIPKYGVTGGAIAWAVAIFVENGLPLLQVRFGMRMQPLSRPTVGTALVAIGAFGGLGVLARALHLGPFLGCAVTAVVGGGLYLVWLRRNSSNLELDALLSSVGSLTRLVRGRAGSRVAATGSDLDTAETPFLAVAEDQLYPLAPTAVPWTGDRDGRRSFRDALDASPSGEATQLHEPARSQDEPDGPTRSSFEVWFEALTQLSNGPNHLPEFAHDAPTLQRPVDVVNAYLRHDIELDLLIRERIGENEPRNLLAVFQSPPGLVQEPGGTQTGSGEGVDSLTQRGRYARSDAIFVNVTNPLKLEKGRRARVLPAEVRVYLLENLENRKIGFTGQTGVHKSTFPPFRLSKEPDDVLGGVRQRSSKVIETRSPSLSDFVYEPADLVGYPLDIDDVEDVLSAFAFDVTNNGIGLRCKELSDRVVERTALVVCAFNFTEHMIRAIRHSDLASS